MPDDTTVIGVAAGYRIDGARVLIAVEELGGGNLFTTPLAIMPRAGLVMSETAVPMVRRPSG